MGEDGGFSLLPSLGTEGNHEQTLPLPPLSQGEAILVTCFISTIIVSGKGLGLVPTITGEDVNGKEVQFGLGHERGQVTLSEACVCGGVGEQGDF